MKEKEFQRSQQIEFRKEQKKKAELSLYDSLKSSKFKSPRKLQPKQTQMIGGLERIKTISDLLDAKLEIENALDRFPLHIKRQSQMEQQKQVLIEKLDKIVGTIKMFQTQGPVYLAN